MAGRRILRTCPVVLVILAFSSLAVASPTDLPPTTLSTTDQPDQEGTEEPTTPSAKTLPDQEGTTEEPKTSLASAEDEPGVEPGCTWQGQHYNVGERWVSGPPDDDCLRYLCIEDGGFSAFTCPEFIPEPGCTKVPGNMSAVFPHCCPGSSCDAAGTASE